MQGWRCAAGSAPAVAGEATSRASVNYEKLVPGVIQQIGYRWADLSQSEDDDLKIGYMDFLQFVLSRT